MRYEIDGVKYPSVTEILKATGYIDTRFIKPGYAERGTYIHELCEQLDVLGIEPKEFFDFEVSARLHAYKEFLEDYKPVIKDIELVVCNPNLGYAGRLDRVVSMKGYDYIIDIKNGQKQPWHRLQLAGYFAAYGKAQKMASLHLYDTRHYRLHEYDPGEAVLEWLGVLEEFKKGRPEV